MKSDEEAYLAELSRICRGGIVIDDRVVSFGGNIKIDISNGYPEGLVKYMDLSYDLVEEFSWLIGTDESINNIVRSGGTHMNDRLVEEDILGGDDDLCRRPLVLVDIDESPQRQVTIPGIEISPPTMTSDRDADLLYQQYLLSAPMNGEHIWLVSLWRALVKQSFNQLYPHYFDEVKELSDTYVFGMVEEWFDFDRFMSDIVKCHNYKYAKRHYDKLDSVEITPYYRSYGDCSITGTWHNASIIGPETAMFLPVREVNEYIDQETHGIVEMHFKNDQHFPINPVLVLFNTGLDKCHVNPKFTLDRVENIAVSALNGKRLRYAKSFGKIKTQQGTDKK